jgi:tagatose-1,6-bisphosphate aldolase
MSYAIGVIRGLRACASAHGTFSILALDHRQNLRRKLRPDNPDSVSYGEMVEFKRAVVGGLAPAVSAFLLDPEIGAAQVIADGSLPARAGLVVAVEATGYVGDSTARLSRVLDGWSVEKVKRMGASALKLLLYYNPAASSTSQQEELLKSVAEACVAADLPLFLEPISFSVQPGAPLTGEERRKVVVETARRLTAIGCDVLKAEFPYDRSVDDPERWADACAELDAASRVPWTVLSGDVGEEIFERQLATACRAGASGFVAGRGVWGDAATMPSTARDEFLSATGCQRLKRLTAISEELGQQWEPRWRSVRQPSEPGEGWFKAY